MIGELLPPEVHAVETSADPPDATLFPAERAVIARAVDKRCREFTTVRHCARTALAGIGVEPAPILPGERGAPVWPVGVVGSMTHCAHYRAAAVARSREIATVGIDAEPNEPLPAGLLDTIARPEERTALAGAAGSPVCWDRLLFSAKESVYKAWFPMTGRWLDFDDATVRLAAEGTFRVHLHVDGPVSGFAGRWCATGGLVLTAIATPTVRRLARPL